MNSQNVFALGVLALLGVVVWTGARGGRDGDTTSLARGLRLSCAALVAWIGVASLLVAILPDHVVAVQLARIEPDRTILPLHGRALDIVRAVAMIATAFLVQLFALLAWAPGPVSRVMQRMAGDIRRFVREVGGDIAQWSSGDGHSHRRFLIAFVVLGLIVRIPALRQPMSYDESITYVWFASRSLLDVVSDYAIPNNHVLSSVFVHLSTAAFGAHPLAVRLPSLLSSLALIFATYWLVRRLLGDRPALIAAALATGAPPFVEHAAQARGYPLMALLSLVAFIALTYLRGERTVTAWVVYATATALAVWTVPVALYATAVTGVWWLIVSRARWWAAVQFTIATSAAGLGALALYTPIMGRQGLRTLLFNDYVLPLELSTLFGVIPHRLGRLLECWTGALPIVIALLLAVALLLGIARKTGGQRAGAVLMISLALGISAMVLAQRGAPHARFLLFAFPLVAGVTASGMASLLERPTGDRLWTLVPLLAFPLAWGGARELRSHAIGFGVVDSVRVDPGAEGVNCCTEGFYGDAGLVAAWAAARASATRPIVAFAGSGMVETVRFAMMERGLLPTLLHPYHPRYGVTQLESYDEVYLIFRRPMGTRLTTDRVLAEFDAGEDPFGGIFEAPEHMAAFPVTDVFRMRRVAGLSSSLRRPPPFKLMEYPH
jgi:hypothetical protein